jgi:hypothetical protein
MDEVLGEWCERWLGSAVFEVLFEAGSLSAVAGVRLADGREVVVKVRRSAPRLQAAYAVHPHVWQCGYPAPEPPRVIGHADWHADNVRWSDGRLLVVHDWDSPVSQPEAVIAGIAAAIFPASGDAWHPATIQESEQFLSAYIRASTRAWTPDDTRGVLGGIGLDARRRRERSRSGRIRPGPY